MKTRRGFDEAIAELERQVIALLRLGGVPRLHERLAAGARVQIDRGALVVLARIGDHGPIRLSDLARLLALDVSTASRHVSRLGEAGYIDRAVDESDHRSSRLTLSAIGRAALADVRAARHQAFTELLGEWRTEDVNRLSAGLHQLNAALTAAAGIQGESDD